MDISKRLWPSDVPDPWMKDAFVEGLVSVIIPTYNRSSVLVEALTSVKQQAYRPVEIIIVDDGSTDDTAEVMATWDKQNGHNEGFRLRYLRKENSGAPAARNRGLIESSGEYIQFLDSDDILNPKKFEKQADCLLSDSAIDFVYSASGFFANKPDWNVVPYCGAPVPRERMVPEFLFCNTCLWNVESGLYRRSICIANGPWDQSLARFQDWEYNIRLLLLGANVAHVPGLFTLARLDSDGRICDSPMQADKVREFFAGIRAVERRILVAGLMSREVRSGIATRYLRYTQTALMAGLKDVAREGVKAGLATHSSLRNTFGFMVCRAILSLPEKQIPSTTHFLLRTLERFDRVRQKFGLITAKYR